MSITVGPAMRDEAEVLTNLHHRAALSAFADIFPPNAPPPSFEEDLARWRYWLGPDFEHGRRAYAARSSGGEIVGVVLTGPDPDEPVVGHLARLYVAPDRWGQGVGTRLYGVAMEDLRSRFSEATLWVLERNRRARSWYERLGWQLGSKRKPTYAPAGIDDVQYRIVLSRCTTPAGDDRSG